MLGAVEHLEARRAKLAKGMSLLQAVGGSRRLAITMNGQQQQQQQQAGTGVQGQVAPGLSRPPSARSFRGVTMAGAGTGGGPGTPRGWDASDSMA